MLDGRRTGCAHALDAQPPRAEGIIGEAFSFNEDQVRRALCGMPNHKAGMEIRQDARGRWSGGKAEVWRLWHQAAAPAMTKIWNQSCRVARVSPLMKLSEICFLGEAKTVPTRQRLPHDQLLDHGQPVWRGAGSRHDRLGDD